MTNRTGAVPTMTKLRRLGGLISLIISHGGFAAAMEELAAVDDIEHGGGELAVVLLERGLHVQEQGLVARHGLTAQGVAEELAAELCVDVGFVLFEVVAQTGEALEFGAVLELAGVVDLAAGFIRDAEATDGVEAFKGEAERIDALMADGAGGIGAVNHEGFTQRGGLHSTVGKLRHIRWWRW